MWWSLRRLGAALAVVVTLTAGCAPPGPSTARSTPVAPNEGDGAEAPGAGGRPLKAAPHWVPVTTLSGAGDHRSHAFEIAGDVLQWRVTATCHDGHLRIGVSGDPEPLVDQACPGRFFGFSIRTGSRALEVTAGGPWEAVVDEQVDRPLTEPPLAGMTDTTALAAGSFRGVEQDGHGTATLFELPDGRRALRLDPFFVTANDDLFVWVSEAKEPRTSADALFTPHVQLEALKATAGAQNYALPDSLPLERVRSIVIWCEPVRTAYATAPLRRR